MSRIGKKPVAVPAGVKVSIDGNTIAVEGKKGRLDFAFHPAVRVGWDESEKAIAVTIDDAKADDRHVRALWGTTRSIIENMVIGVTNGYEKKMEVVGVGWTAALAGQALRLNVGFASPVEVSIPSGVSVAVEKQLITISGADKQAVGQFAAMVRSKRPPEPYNGKGIKYADEVIQRKQGKQFGS
jgi:large subunit ribosomal protein L6